MKMIQRVQIVLVILALLIPMASMLTAGESTTPRKHPQVLTADQTVKVFLEGFVARDIETIMAYLPNGESERMKQWREKMSNLFKRFMSEKRHIKKINGIKIKETRDSDRGKMAMIITTFETTPNFSGRSSVNAEGKTVATYNWAFLQKDEKSPWLFDGGGF